MRFKDFEFRPPTFLDGHTEKDWYNLVKWTKTNDGKEYHFVIASIKYNNKECGWDFASCGTRYLQYREDGLEEWVLRFIDLLNVQKKYEEE